MELKGSKENVKRIMEEMETLLKTKERRFDLKQTNIKFTTRSEIQRQRKNNLLAVVNEHFERFKTKFEEEIKKITNIDYSSTHIDVQLDVEGKDLEKMLAEKIIFELERAEWKAEYKDGIISIEV